MTPPELELHQLRMAEEIARSGCYSLHQRTGEYTWTPGMYTLLELDPSVPASFEVYRELIPEQDRAAWTLAAQVRLNGDQPYVREYRLWVGPHRREIWVRARSAVITMAGDPYMVGVVLDVTEQMHTRQEIAELNDRLLDVVAEQQKTIELLAQAQALLGTP